MNSAVPPAPRAANRLLAALRRWHTWLGVLAALFLLVFGLTGIILNYKKPLLTALGLEPAEYAKLSAPRSAAAEPPAVPFTTQNGFAAAAVSPAEALERARAELGEVPLERIELKQERGDLVWKIKSRAGHEVLIHALTGQTVSKGPYEKLGPAGADGQPSRSFDWGKFFLDLHTGKIGGEVGKAVMTIAAGVLLFLTGSGLYLWLKPLLVRRANARRKAAAARAAAPPPVRPAPLPTATTETRRKAPALVAQD